MTSLTRHHISSVEAECRELRDALAPLAEHAMDRCASAPEWRDSELISIVVTIGDLRAAVAALQSRR